MTNHQIHFGAAQKMDKIEDDSVNLIVTSPPYPMIEMWDEILFKQNQAVKSAFSENQFEEAYELMHVELDKVWKECFRVLKDGGIACINIGDATRTLDKNFRLFSNHARIIAGCLKHGFQNLPNIIWRKPTNAPNKFMGSGMLPPGAYVTLEHEFILIFRKNEKRSFLCDDQKENRQTSAYFWEERNEWFSDVWEIRGATQKIKNKSLRERSAAYPFEIPYRLINMFSTKNDVVLDPFLGTGTTSLAAIASHRHSIGYDIDETFESFIFNNLLNQETAINEMIKDRLQQHISFVEDRIAQKGKENFKYVNEFYNFPVMTRQELTLEFPLVDSIERNEHGIVTSYLETQKLQSSIESNLSQS